MFCSALVFCGVQSRVGAAATPCDAFHAFDTGSVSAIADDPACLRKLRADLRNAREPFPKSALTSALVIGDNRMASEAWRRGAFAEARRYWTQSVTDGRIKLMTADEPGLKYLLDKQYGRAFHWLLCRSDAECRYPRAFDESLEGYGVNPYLVDGVRSAARGDYSAAEATLSRAAHEPVPLPISGNPQSFFILGIVELCEGKRFRAIDHLIEASKRTGKGAPEIAPDAFWAGVAAQILLGL